MGDARLVAALGGGAVGASLAGLVYALAAETAADDTNGWIHDADGWLLYLVPVAGLVGMALGTWLALRLTRHDKRASTAAVAVAVTPAVAAFGMLGSWYPVIAAWFAAPAVARWLLTRKRG